MITELKTETDFKEWADLLKHLSAGAVYHEGLGARIHRDNKIVWGWKNEEGRLVGTVSLLVEQKGGRLLGKVGHLEDLVVHPDYRGWGIGSLLIQHVVKAGKNLGCYKVILECGADLENYYKDMGFKTVGLSMRIDL